MKLSPLINEHYNSLGRLGSLGKDRQNFPLDNNAQDSPKQIEPKISQEKNNNSKKTQILEEKGTFKKLNLLAATKLTLKTAEMIEKLNPQISVDKLHNFSKEPSILIPRYV